MDPNYRDMLGQLCEKGVDFLLVGAHAMGAHRIPRATVDMDIWIRPARDNAARVWRALADFGAPLNEFNVEDFINPYLVAQFGVAPVIIDLLTSLSGLQFETAWINRVYVNIEGLNIPILSKTDLILNKRASGRAKDLIDIELLEGRDPDRRQK